MGRISSLQKENGPEEKTMKGPIQFLSFTYCTAISRICHYFAIFCVPSSKYFGLIQFWIQIDANENLP